MNLGLRFLTVVVFALILVTQTTAQVTRPLSETYARRNTFAALAEYSNDSSHIILGSAPNRKFVAFGLQYERRLLSGHGIAWNYLAEFRPVILESDPTASGTDVVTGSNPPGVNGTFNFGPSQVFVCRPGVQVYSVPPPSTYAETVTTHCGRQWNYAQGLSPVGTRLNFRTRHRLQPTISSVAGYIFSTRSIPISNAGNFNFDFEAGAGFEFFQSLHRSIRIEYQVQHFSNHNTAYNNPGVDNGLVKLTYAFGR